MSSHLPYPVLLSRSKLFLADYNINRETNIDYFLIHPANKMIVDRIVKKLKLSKEKVPYNLEEFGNDVGEDETDGCSTISSIKVII